MPHPDVRYCTTDDGLRIAYTVSGSGSPLVFINDPIGSHVQLEWDQPFQRRLYGELARHNTLVRLDPRGTGMSDRQLPMTLDDGVRDVFTVIERLGLSRFPLVGAIAATTIVVPFAARYPQRVSRLVLVDGYLRTSDRIGTPQARSVLAAALADFNLATEAMGASIYGLGREESVTFGGFVRACVDPGFLTHLPILGFDNTEDARAVTCPTLIIRHDDMQQVTHAMTRQMAAEIPDARLAVRPGMLADDIPGLAHQITSFINEDASSPAHASSDTGAVRIVLFTDVVGHTAMMNRLGDERGRELLREHERITRDTLKQHAGTELKSLGDGFMASFNSATAAMRCAVGLQRAFAERNLGASEPLQVRVGLDAGEPVEDAGDLFGSTVILASRVCAQAGPGEILVPEPVRHLLAGKGVAFADRGEFLLKGFEDRVRLYEVHWRL